MEVRFNVSGAQRKEMVKTISAALDGWDARYLGVPSCSYQVGDFEITRHGALVFDDRTDTEMVEKVLEALAQAGFECEEQTAAAETAEESTENTEEKPEQTMEMDTAPMEKPTVAEPQTDKPSDNIVNLSISLPRDSFTTAALDNLDGLLTSKGNLIRKAFGIEEATYTLTDDRITFAWMSGEITPEASKACQDFIGKLCEMAKTQKRVTAKPKAYENEKYAFRCFLLRLGLIGNEYKTSRKILLKNLSGNSSWKDGKRKEAAQDEVSDAHGCASVGAGA